MLSQLKPAPAVNKTYTASIMDDNTWKILLETHETGGNYSLTVECSSGCVNTGPSNNSASAVDLTFGDVLHSSAVHGPKQHVAPPRQHIQPQHFEGQGAGWAVLKRPNI